MRMFDYKKAPEKLLTPEIVQMVASIHEHKGKQELFLEANQDELKTLLEVAMIQSTGASNRIEGIYTTDKRLKELVSQKAEPRNRSEEEISGYREVLATIHESYEYIVPGPNIILQLHRDLYSYSSGAVGGNYKNSDNLIAETEADGHQKARFIPVPAFQTAEAVEELCNHFLEAWEANYIDKLILIPMFILDFLCIHPFNEGNVTQRHLQKTAQQRQTALYIKLNSVYAKGHFTFYFRWMSFYIFYGIELLTMRIIRITI